MVNKKEGGGTDTQNLDQTKDRKDGDLENVVRFGSGWSEDMEVTCRISSDILTMGEKNGNDDTNN